MNLPTAWDVSGKSTLLNVDANVLRVNYTDHDADVKDVVIRTNYPIPSNCKLFYFEISIIDKSENGTIAIGICTESAKLKTMPGCEDNSWAYYNDNGDFYDSSIINVPYGPMFNTGDTIGCCLNFRKNTAFFTKNGIHLGIALRGLKDNLYACVGLRLQNGSIETNFGHQKFKYSAMNDDDIDDELLKDKWVNVLNRCNNQLTDVFVDLIKLMKAKQDDILTSKYFGKVYFVMGEYRMALEYLTKLLENELNNSFALRYRGEIYLILNEFEKSYADLNKLFEIDRKDVWAFEARKEINRRRFVIKNLEERWQQREAEIEENAALAEWGRGATDEIRLRGQLRLHAAEAALVLRGEEQALLRREEMANVERRPNYGECENCKEFNTFFAWCQTCDPKITAQGWSSGDNDIDKCIKYYQHKAITYTDTIEWIPFDRLDEIEKIGEGGFGTVFSAIWLDGIRMMEFKDGIYLRSRKQLSKVALKTLPDSQDLDYLKEFKNHMECRLKGIDLEIYGLTKDTDGYLMVFRFADCGSLDKFLKYNFENLTWEYKLWLLIDISCNLARIHQAGYTHNDFHSGNILQNKISEIEARSYIADLGLSKKFEEHTQFGKIYGVLPYVAPEVLLGKGYTPAADIYGFGIIMTEISSGRRPFDGHAFDLSLSLNICNGLRPEFSPGTPDCYIKLAEKCMDSDPQNRPTANEIRLMLYRLWYFIKDFVVKYDKLHIKEKFLAADKIIKTLPNIERKHQDSIYTSKIIDTKAITALYINCEWEIE